LNQFVPLHFLINGFDFLVALNLAHQAILNEARKRAALLLRDALGLLKSVAGNRDGSLSFGDHAPMGTDIHRLSIVHPFTLRERATSKHTM